MFFTSSPVSRTIVIDCAPIGFMDTVGAQALLQVRICNTYIAIDRTFEENKDVDV